MSAFQKATKKKSKLRAALFGPSGSGKTFTSLRIATGLGGKIAVIDTERGSASKYSDRFDFDVCELANKTIAGYCKVIKDAHGEYDVLIIDSLSHGWQELLEQVEKLAQAKYRGNTWSAWSEGTPLQRKLVDAILDFPGHVIATMRSKTEWTTAKQDNGKSAPVRVGLAPEQGKGIEYEFDLLLELTVDHVCNVLKDRTGKFQDQLIDKPDEEFGKSLADWLSEGEEVKPTPPPEPKPEPTDSERHAGNIAIIRKKIIKQSPEGESANVEKLFCDKAAALCEDNRARYKLEEFTLDEIRPMVEKANGLIKDILTYAGVSKP
jgi:hypothetical protein